MSERTARFRSSEKRPVVVAILMFVLTTVTVVVVNSYLHEEFIPTYSISRYVGMETWSAVVFALANLVVAFRILMYLYRVGEKWQFWRSYYWVVVMVVAGLVGLSMWPIGYFDLPGQGFATSMPSRVHIICSRTMFLGMSVIAATILFCKRASRVTRIMAALYVAYGVVCILGHMTKARWFIQHLLLFESCYLFGFLSLCLGMQGNNKIKENNYGRGIKEKA